MIESWLKFYHIFLSAAWDIVLKDFFIWLLEHIVSWLSSYLVDHFFSISSAGFPSSPQFLILRVLQDSVFGPLLLYLHVLPWWSHPFPYLLNHPYPDRSKMGIANPHLVPEFEALTQLSTWHIHLKKHYTFTLSKLKLLSIPARRNLLFLLFPQSSLSTNSTCPPVKGTHCNL